MLHRRKIIFKKKLEDEKNQNKLLQKNVEQKQSKIKETEQAIFKSNDEIANLEKLLSDFSSKKAVLREELSQISRQIDETQSSSTKESSTSNVQEEVNLLQELVEKEKKKIRSYKG